MTAGRRAIIALNTARAVSYAGGAGVMTVPVKFGTTTGAAWVISPPGGAAATGRPRLGRTLLRTSCGAPSQQKTKCSNARAGEHVRDAQSASRHSAPDQSSGHGGQHRKPGEAAHSDSEQENRGAGGRVGDVADRRGAEDGGPRRDRHRVGRGGDHR